MDALPIRPQTPHAPQRTTHRPAHRPAHRGAAAAGPVAEHPAAHASAHASAPAAHAPKAPASPGDLAALAQQASFDAIASARAEQQREMNALRDLAMQQVKRDDQVLNDWIRLI
jgi:3-oxoacyl-ACP reductase-like protein